METASRSRFETVSTVSMFVLAHTCCIIPALQSFLVGTVALGSWARLSHTVGVWLMIPAIASWVYLVYTYGQGLSTSRRKKIALNPRKVALRFSFLGLATMSLAYAGWMHYQHFLQTSTFAVPDGNAGHQH